MPTLNVCFLQPHLLYRSKIIGAWVPPVLTFTKAKSRRIAFVSRPECEVMLNVWGENIISAQTSELAHHPRLAVDTDGKS